MVRLKLVLLVTLTTLLIGCVLPITVVGPVGARIDSSEVVIYYPQRPDCNFETVGYILIEGGYYSLKSLFGEMRLQAASVGADAVYVLHTLRLDIKEYVGSAKAIRCDPV
ncbi:MAG: hypothetical protein IIC58_01255 [Proteobacteria bacterium]|nr:hypothetical protein [Pseudomonadota bacterium]